MLTIQNYFLHFSIFNNFLIIFLFFISIIFIYNTLKITSFSKYQEAIAGAALVIAAATAYQAYISGSNQADSDDKDKDKKKLRN